MSRRSPLLLVLALAVVGAVAYVRSGPEWLKAPSPAAPASPPPAADALLHAPRARLEFAIFHLPAPKLPASKELARLIPLHFPGLRMTDSGDGPVLPALELSELEAKEYAPPEPGHFNARGLTAADEAALGSCQKVTLLRFHTAVPALDDFSRAHVLALELATMTGGLLWDEDTSEVFSPAGWRERRLDQWSDGYPRVAWHFMVQVSEEDDGMRLATAGLRKFGLPDLELVGVPRSQVEPGNDLLNVTAQLLVEQAGTVRAGAFPVEFASIKAGGLRVAYDENYADGQKKTAVVLSPARLEGSRRFVALAFPQDRGATHSERLNAVTSELFGSQDSVTQVNHDEEILAASERAKKRLLGELKRHAQRGLPFGEQLLVKAPFKTSSGGNEWMWVDVARWRGKVVEGTLANEPDDVPGLKAGAPVMVQEDELFDFIRELPDGGREGNETGELMSKRQR